jgi:hypothetical protein
MAVGARCCSVVCLGLVVVLLSGCGKPVDPNRPTTVRVTGTITYNQQPVEGAGVVFVPQDHSHAATARTNAEGRFQLRTFGTNDGAVPGSFKVTVVKTEGRPGAGSNRDDDGLGEEEDDDDEDETPPKWLTPQRYGSVATTDLTADVTEGGDNSFTFELTD